MSGEKNDPAKSFWADVPAEERPGLKVLAYIVSFALLAGAVAALWNALS